MSLAPGRPSPASSSLHSMKESRSSAPNSDSGFAGSVSGAPGTRVSTRSGVGTLGAAGAGLDIGVVGAGAVGADAAGAGAAGTGAGWASSGLPPGPTPIPIMVLVGTGAF